MTANKSHRCNAVQFSDQMSCSCGNVWDMNDPYPPECKKEPTMTTNMDKQTMTPQQLRAIKAKLGWTNDRLASELGVSKSSVEKYLAGSMTVRKVVALAVQYLVEQHAVLHPCPECGAALTSLSSMNCRLCTGCGAEAPWKLKPGQVPTVGTSRSGRKGHVRAE